MKLSDFPLHVQKRIKEDNPGVFGHHLGAMEGNQPKPASTPALDSHGQKLKGSQSSVAVRISLVVLSRRAMDPHDNLPGACKPLADGISESLGLDDSEISWEYGWVKTSGQQGVLVKISKGAR